ncbi:hypothetical protein MWU77_17745 [Rhodococcus sp. F64268]|uniref:hypothetical protein n=1 Tax=unclassified Rhodococcus (in: high G+C Gram-positive bacteria) TaxID=192944 RepID=UPI001F0D7F80|nr:MULTISPECIES: hypothetical protein [unclassified Rhodococcus (in: high G+C Gram-positive bacteria)]MCK0092622.1 hypothetical protein [Rhodococcus sp. F64268]
MYWSANTGDGVGGFGHGGVPGGNLPPGRRGAEPPLRSLLEARLPDLAPCARLLAGSHDVDTALLDRAVARAAATWREPVGPELCAYVLYWFGYLLQAKRPHCGPPHPDLGVDDTVLFGALSPLEQVTIVLSAYDGLPSARVAALAGRALAEFELDESRAIVG